MARLCGACCGLVVFSAMIIRGTLAGNSAQQIILRSVTGMFAALLLGGAVGWVGMVLVRDNLPKPPPEPDASEQEVEASTIKTVS